MTVGGAGTPPPTAPPCYGYIMGCLHQRRCSIPINDLVARIGLLRHLVNGLQLCGTSNPIQPLKKGLLTAETATRVLFSAI